jgi:hypothetical protein
MTACRCGCESKIPSRGRKLFHVILNLAFAIVFTGAALHPGKLSPGADFLTWLVAAVFWLVAIVSGLRLL